MGTLYPSAVNPASFQVGDCVRKWVTEWNLTPFVGFVTHIVPSTYKVWVQWAIGGPSPEDPETLIKVNPQVSGMPTDFTDRGYDSYEKGVSEKNFGALPHRITPSRDLQPIKITAVDKMAIRIAHTFAMNVINRLIDDISICKKANLSDVQAYNKIYTKYEDICSDHIMRTSIDKVYTAGDND